MSTTNASAPNTNATTDETSNDASGATTASAAQTQAQTKATLVVTEIVPAFLSGAQRVYMTAHSTCAMCDTKLEIRHEINQFEFKIKEEAHCPSCGIRVRAAHHVLH